MLCHKHLHFTDVETSCMEILLFSQSVLITLQILHSMHAELQRFKPCNVGLDHVIVFIMMHEMLMDT